MKSAIASAIPQTSSEAFYLSLITFVLRSKQQLSAAGARHGLSPMQLMTLVLTDNTAPHSMNSFGRLYDCDASNITGIIDGLEQKGLVERGTHKFDRRIKVIRLTSLGEQIKNSLFDELSSAKSGLLGQLSDSQAADFQQLLISMNVE